MKAFCLGGLLCLALNASALTYTYSGTVSSSTAQLWQTGEPIINVGDTFTVTYAAHPSPLGSALPTVSFGITVGSYSFQTYPFEFSGFYSGMESDFRAFSQQEIWGAILFRGTAIVNVTETGGQIEINLTRRVSSDVATGGFSVSFGSAAVAPSSQPVPEAASTLGLLALGFASVVGLRFHRVS